MISRCVLALLIVLQGLSVSAQVVVDSDLTSYGDPNLCRTSIEGRSTYIIFDSNEDVDSQSYSFRDSFFGGTDSISCPAYVSLRVMTPGLTDEQRTVFCLKYDEEKDTYLGIGEGFRDAYLACAEPGKTVCERVNASKEAAIALAGLGAGATAGTSIATSAAGVTAVTHSSGAIILTGSSGYIAGTLGTIGGAAVSILTAPATLAAAAVTVVTVGGAVYICS